MKIETFGNRLRKLRIKHKYSQEQLAKFIGVGRVSISNWEGNKNTIMAIHLFKCAEVFQVDPHWLFFG